MRFLVLIFIFLTACATRNHLHCDYLESSKNSNYSHHSQKTTILFLVDGLSYRILENQLYRNQLPNLKKYFLSNNAKLQKAHTVFPTLTYTNISGILHEKPVHLTEAMGNKVLYKNKLIDFESAADRRYFSRLMKGRNIFTRLNEKKYNTVSLDYGLGVDASVVSRVDFPSAYAASQLDYSYLDFNKIESLKALLNHEKISEWPEFIFIHLVGFDSLSHRYGANSNEAISYLKKLDENFSAIFKILKKNENRHQITSILTADHGFNSKANNYFNIEALAKNIDSSIRVVNEARFAALYYMTTPTADQLLASSKKFLKMNNIEIVAYKIRNRVRILTKNKEYYFDELAQANCMEEFLNISYNGSNPICTNQLPATINDEIHPFFIENLASYFRSSKSPDILVIPASNTIFSRHGLGFHGGPTEEETIVPLLMRNAKLQNPEQIIPSWQILNFVN